MNALSAFEWDQLEMVLTRPEFVDVAVTVHGRRGSHLGRLVSALATLSVSRRRGLT